MASHQVAIAKASFAAALLRPDPASASRDEISTFHTALDNALSHCSTANIQRCKSWLLHYVVSSSNRVGGFGKYLVALATSLTSAGNDAQPGNSSSSSAADGHRERRTSTKRKSLHLLYLLHDLFHHTKFHMQTTTAFSTLSGSLQPYMVDLLGSAASYDRQKNPKHHRRLDELLNIWDEHGFYSSDYVNKLREVVRNSASTGAVKTSIGVDSVDFDGLKKSSGKDAPFMMPPTHGDTSTPYYDLPAGNLVPHIVPNSTAPLRPESIRPLQFLAGPADQKLVTALKDFLGKVDRLYGANETAKQDDGVVDIDELGQKVIRDQNTDEIIDGETYYGWSRAFCEQMKKRRTKNSRGRSESRSRSRSVSRHKRRHYSDSLASEDSRRSVSRSPSRSRSRSASRGQPSRRRYGSPSRSRSVSRRRSRPRERSYSPRPSASHHGQQYVPPPSAPPAAAHSAPPPPMHIPSGAGAHFALPPMAPGKFPASPPRPPNCLGPWPPPPPPMAPGSMGVGVTPSAFPPQFLQQSGQFPPPTPNQAMPVGPYHFPPPHMGNQWSTTQGGWAMSGAPGTQPPAGRGWR